MMARSISLALRRSIGSQLNIKRLRHRLDDSPLPDAGSVGGIPHDGHALDLRRDLLEQF